MIEAMCKAQCVTLMCNRCPREKGNVKPRAHTGKYVQKLNSLFFEGLHGPGSLLVTPKRSESRVSRHVTMAATKSLMFCLGNGNRCRTKGIGEGLDRRAGVKTGEKKNRLPAVPQWKMIPRFKTRVYVLFVFPALSVSVEGRTSERETLVFHWQGKTKKGASFCEIQWLSSGR